MKEAAERFRDFLISQPAALYVYLRHPVVSPTAILRMESMLEVARSAGFEDEFALHAYGVVQTYTIGFAALEASRIRSAQQSVGINQVIARLAARLATYTTSRQFRVGLMYLSEGIEHRRVEER